MQHDDLILVEDMLVEVREALEFIEGFSRESFVHDRRTRKAVVHCVQTIGEAAAHLSPEFTAAHPEVPWAKVVGMRHRLVHGYRGVSYDLVWLVMREEVPALEAALTPLLDGDR